MNRFVTTVRPNKQPDKIKDLSIIILGATVSNRMLSYGPSALYSIGEDFLLTHQYDIVHSYFPNAEVTATIGYMADRVLRRINRPIRFIENQLWETTSPVEDLRLALNIVQSNNVLIIPGDLYFDPFAIETLVPSSCLVIDVHDQIINEAGVTIGDEYVESISYGLSPVWTGMFLVEDISVLRKVISNRKLNKLCMFEIIEKLINRHCRFLPVYHQNMVVIRMSSGKVMDKD